MPGVLPDCLYRAGVVGGTPIFPRPHHIFWYTIAFEKI